MKGLKIFAASTLLILALCSGQIQIAKTTSENVPLKHGFYTYEDDKVTVVYNLWAERGMFGMLVFNNTDSTLYIDWEDTYFFFNGSNYDYRIDNGIGGWGDDTSGRANAFAFKWAKKLFPGTKFSTEMTEGRYQAIPPKGAMAAAKYRLINLDIDMTGASFYKYECNDEENKSGRGIKFTTDNTPFFFQNFVAYKIDDTSATRTLLTHDFWVNELMLFRSLTVNTGTADEKGGANGCLYNEGSSFYIRTNTGKY